MREQECILRLTPLNAWIQNEPSNGGAAVRRWWWPVGMFMVAGTFALVLISCSTTSRILMEPPQIEGATYVGDKICLDCHATISHAFPASPHARLRLNDPQLAGMQGCESCHGPASKHVAAGGGRENSSSTPARTRQPVSNATLKSTPNSTSRNITRSLKAR